MGRDSNIFECNTIEELKANIKEALEDEGIAMRLVALDKDGNPRTVDIRDMVEEIGIDDTAELIFTAKQASKDNINSTELSLTQDEMLNLLERYKEDPDSLTENELVIAKAVLNSASEEKLNTANELMALIMRTFYDLGGKMYNTVSGFSTVLCTLLTGNFVMSTNVKNDQPAIFEEKVSAVINSIKLPENVDSDIVAMALLKMFNEIVADKKYKHCEIDHESFLEVLGLKNIYKKIDETMDEFDTTFEEGLKEKPNNNNIVDIRGRIKNNK